MDALMLGLRVLAGGAAVCYVAFLLFRASRPVAGISPAAAPPAAGSGAVADMRIVLDLAARLREAGKGDAVKLCQQLLDEMLKPEVKA